MTADETIRSALAKLAAEKTAAGARKVTLELDLGRALATP